MSCKGPFRLHATVGVGCPFPRSARGAFEGNLYWRFDLFIHICIFTLNSCFPNISQGHEVELSFGLYVACAPPNCEIQKFFWKIELKI